MSRRLRGSVIVITGASSGIGRATAREFARCGATVVLAARREEALKAALAECEDLGGRGLVAPTDVSDADQVERLANTAVENYGRIDVWVNNAAVYLLGRIEETPHELYERVININLLGCANGARAAIRRFREQREGCLINVSSMVGHAGEPYASAYVSSKWAIRGLSECLRMELMDAPGIQVSTVLPASIDTPLYQHAANYTGRAIKAMKPVYPPEQVATAILRLAQRPEREVFVGNAGRMVAALHTLAPAIAEASMAWQVEIDHFQDGQPAPQTDGNVFEPMADGRGARGGWLVREHPPQRLSPGAGIAIGLAILAVPLGLYAWTRQRSRMPPQVR
jgi:NAD(P)-dependent dehydrogenase (short-subunit alcohol dehydrogenase family)